MCKALIFRTVICQDHNEKTVKKENIEQQFSLSGPETAVRVFSFVGTDSTASIPFDFFIF